MSTNKKVSSNTINAQYSNEKRKKLMSGQRTVCIGKNSFVASNFEWREQGRMDEGLNEGNSYATVLFPVHSCTKFQKKYSSQCLVYLVNDSFVLCRKYDQDGTNAVSYTHLDVYKRQFKSLNNSSLFRSCRYRFASTVG